MVPEIRSAALTAQASSFHHLDSISATPTLMCELGFLFHMMCSVEANRANVPPVAIAANFQRALQQIPETVALGLLEGRANRETSAPSSAGGTTQPPPPQQQELQGMMQLFVRFLLNQLQREHELEASQAQQQLLAAEKSVRNTANAMNTSSAAHANTASAVDRVFGYDTCCSNQFRQDVDPTGLAQGRTRVRAFSLELMYPNTAQAAVAKRSPTASASKANSYTSFSTILWNSFRREASMRGWCSTSESYEMLRQRRCVDLRSLSPLLVVTCGDTIKAAPGDIASPAPSSSSTPEASKSNLRDFWLRRNSLGGSWLADEIEVWQIGRADVDSEMGKLVVSSRLRGLSEVVGEGDSASPSPTPVRWLAFDGHTEAVLQKPAGELMGGGKYAGMLAPGGDDNGTVCRMRLVAVISQVPDSDSVGSNGARQSKHLILHVLRKTLSSLETEQWVLINDLIARPVTLTDVLSFHEWKHPCVLFYAREEYKLADVMTMSSLYTSLPVTVPSSVFNMKSLSSIPSIIPKSLPGKGDLVAFDAEFVTVEVQKMEIDSQGQRMDGEGRQILARVSLIDASKSSGSDDTPVVLADDCVLPNEAVVDYVTRFSGLTEEDLTPSTSRFSLVTHRTAYLKLRCFVDRGCVIVGHGLKKDFETANIFVPPHQVSYRSSSLHTSTVMIKHRLTNHSKCQRCGRLIG